MAEYNIPFRAYRSKTLLALKDTEEDGQKLLIKELAILDELVKVHLKNYQVWYAPCRSYSLYS